MWKFCYLELMHISTTKTNQMVHLKWEKKTSVYFLEVLHQLQL